MRRLVNFRGILLFAFLLLVSARSAPAAEVVVLPLKGAVNPAMVELVQDVLAAAERDQAGLVLLEIDTPGGLLSSTRDIVEAIFQSRVPVAAYVAPSGAQCASAGTFIALACPVLAMAPGTNLGAAHPVMPFGKMDETMEKKAVNDAAAWIGSLAGRWGRNRIWAESAVRESAALDENGALSEGVIDLVAADRNDLLVKIDGRRVTLEDKAVVIRTTGAPVREIKPNLRQRVL
ncbi:MAG TPA: hypothetical protein PKN80_06780 [bacterium]|nr:hypothetical protein [bacterium]